MMVAWFWRWVVRRERGLRVVVLVGWMGVGGMAGAQSFECRLAKTDVEKAVCASKELSAADERLATVYKSVLAMAPSDVQAEIRLDERIWASNRGRFCTSIAKSAGFKQERQPDLVSCLKALYESQTASLAGRVTRREGIVFVLRSRTLTSKNDPDDPPRGDDSGDANPGYGTLSATWPQAVSETPEWRAWNAAVLAATQKVADTSGDAPDGKWHDAWAAEGEYDIRATVDAVTSQMVAVSIVNGWDGHGAAHPNENSVQFNWIRKEGRELKASDVFADGTPWTKLIESRCRTSMKEGVGDDYEGFVGKDKFGPLLHEIVVSPTNWRLSAKGLMIVFQDYQLEAHAFRPEDVEVPWSALTVYLAKGFVVPR